MHYLTSVRMDEVWAEELAKMDQPDEDAPPSPLGYTTEALLLLGVIGELRSIRAQSVANTGGDAPQIPPFRAPETLVDRLRQGIVDSDLSGLIEQATGGRYTMEG